ncbi:oligosaccharide flippase family protein [Parageobacillus thermoglucosidasius]|uniref:oligosaccharide flippase family protein n=1 Tax=Parageobacillus thermoglucosidasius TaxID=1426 RepID=UPI0027EC27A6|nr:flippase [Parageobacillus thermoglucosidasius]
MKAKNSLVDSIYNIYSKYNNRSWLLSRFINAISWGIIGTIFSKASLFISNIIIARVLGTTQYGEYSIINSTINLFASFAGVGLGLTAVKYVAEFKSKDLKKTGDIISVTLLFSILTGFLMMVAVFFLSDFISQYILSAQHINPILKISAPMLLFFTVTGVLTGIIQGLELFKSLAVINIGTGFISLLLVTVGVYFYGIIGVVVANVIIQFIILVIFAYVVFNELRKRKINLSFVKSRTEYRVLLKFSFPAFVSNVLVVPVIWIGHSILVNQPNGYSELGVFNAAYQWQTILLFIPTVIGTSITPIMSERFGNGDIQAVRKSTKIIMALSIFIVVPIAIALSSISPWIMGQYGEEFTSGWKVLTIVLITVCVMSIQMPVGNLITASGKMWAGLGLNGAWAFLFLTSFAFLKTYGAIGMALSLLVAYTFHTVWSTIIAFSIVKR